MNSLIPLALTVAVLDVACQPVTDEVPENTVETDRRVTETQAIQSLSDRYGVVVTEADVDGFLDLLTEDAVLMPPNGDMLVGKESIRPLLESAFDRDSNTFFEERTTPSEIQVAGRWAFDRGITTIRTGPKDGAIVERTNKYIRIWERQADRSWKLARVIWNRNPGGA